MGKFHDAELPGEDLILKGLDDLAAGNETIESLLVRIGAPRLRRLGFVIPEDPNSEYPETRLYLLLHREDPMAAHSRMNALVRRLVSFESTMELLSVSSKPPN